MKSLLLISAASVATLASFAEPNTPKADEMGTIEGEHLIRLAKKHPGMLLLLTSSEKLVHPFEKHLNPMHQRIGLKPMDLRGFHWLLQGNRPSSESA